MNGSQGSGKFLSLRGQHSRSVSHEELRDLGLSKAVNEYHKLVKEYSLKKSSCGGEDSDCCVGYIFKRVFFCPCLIRPEDLACVACNVTGMILTIVNILTVILTPILVGMLFSPERFISLTRLCGFKQVDTGHSYSCAVVLGILLFAADLYTRRKRLETWSHSQTKLSCLEDTMMYGPLVIMSKTKKIADGQNGSLSNGL